MTSMVENNPLFDPQVCDKTCVITLWRTAFEKFMNWKEDYAEKEVELNKNGDTTNVVQLWRASFKILTENNYVG